MDDKRHPEYDPVVVEALDKTANQRLRLGAIADKLTAEADQAIAEIQAKLAADLADLEQQASQLDLEIVRTVKHHQKWLMPGRLRSFVTTSGVYKLTYEPEAVQVETNHKKSIMEIARQHHLVKQIANPPSGSYRFSKAKFDAFVKKSAANFKLFANFVTKTEAGDRVTLSPNRGQLVEYNGERLSPSSVTIGRIAQPGHSRSKN